jgi:hypothetical protein
VKNHWRMLPRNKNKWKRRKNKLKQ